LSRVWIAATAILALSTVITLILAPTALGEGASTSFHFYVYGSTTCPHCHALLDFLRTCFGEKHIYFCPVNVDPLCMDRLVQLCRLLKLRYAVVPLTLVVCGDRVKAIVVGQVCSRSFWTELLESNTSLRVPVYLGPSKYLELVFNNTSSLREFTETAAPELFGLSTRNIVAKAVVIQVSKGGHAEVTRIEGFLSLLAIAVPLALSDSINPCALYIYVLLLIAAALSSGSSRRAMLLTGIAFVSAIYVGYLALGLGLLKALTYVPAYRWVFGAIALGFGAWTIVSGVAKKSRVAAKGLVYDLLPRASTSVPISFALGLFVTFTLLPCSAGPYVTFLGIASRYPQSVVMPVLLIYNLLFVSPMLGLLGAISATMRFESVQRAIVERGPTLSIIAGAILALIGVLVLLNLI